MTAPLKAIDGNADLPALMTELANRARAAARVLALASAGQKNRALDAIERAIRANAPAILAANAEDVAEVRAGGATSAFIDRLTLTPARIEAMADGVATVRGIADPIGAVTESWQRPNGMTIERVRVPLGVIAVIFESRPNVAADAGVLCLKSGNAVILRGGSDSFRSCRAIHDCLVQGLRQAGLPEAAITLVPTRDRAAVGLLLTGLNVGVDLSARAGVRASRRRQPRLCRSLRQSRNGEVDRAQCQDAAPRCLRRCRNLAGRSRRRGNQPEASGGNADRCRLRGAWRRRRAARRRQGKARLRRRLGHRI
jgi:glutamate-5-semialdehyde dehydrogenase